MDDCLQTSKWKFRSPSIKNTSDVQRSAEMATAVYWPISAASDHPADTLENQLDFVVFLSPAMTDFSESLYVYES